MLVITGVVGVGWTRVHYRRQQLIMKKVEELGGRVFIDARMSGRLPRVKFGAFTPGPLEIFDEVCGIDLSSTAATDNDLAELQAMGALSQAGYLVLTGTRVSDEGLQSLRGMSRLGRLDLGRTRITDSGLKHLDGMPGLRSLYLSETEITDAGLEHLRGLGSVDTLLIERTGVSDAAIAELRQRVPTLVVFK